MILPGKWSEDGTFGLMEYWYREDTFRNVADWLREAKMHTSADVKIYLVGN